MMWDEGWRKLCDREVLTVEDSACLLSGLGPDEYWPALAGEYGHLVNMEDQIKRAIHGGKLPTKSGHTEPLIEAGELLLWAYINRIDIHDDLHRKLVLYLRTRGSSHGNAEVNANKRELILSVALCEILKLYESCANKRLSASKIGDLVSTYWDHYQTNLDEPPLAQSGVEELLRKALRLRKNR